MESIKNRNEAYKWVLDNNDVNANQQLILDALHKFGVLTDSDLSYNCGLAKNVVNARRNELVQMNLVAEMGSKIDPDTKRTVTLWGLVYKGEQSTQEVPLCLKDSEMRKLETWIKRKANEHQRNKIRGWLD